MYFCYLCMFIFLKIISALNYPRATRKDNGTDASPVVHGYLQVCAARRDMNLLQVFTADVPLFASAIAAEHRVAGEGKGEGERELLQCFHSHSHTHIRTTSASTTSSRRRPQPAATSTARADVDFEMMAQAQAQQQQQQQQRSVQQ